MQIDEIALFCYNIYILNSSIVPDTEIVMNGHKCAERFMQRRLSRFFNVSHIHIIKKSKHGKDLNFEQLYLSRDEKNARWIYVRLLCGGCGKGGSKNAAFR